MTREPQCQQKWHGVWQKYGQSVAPTCDSSSRLQSKPSRYMILSYYCWWRNFHSSQLICYKYPKCFLFGFLQHFPDLNWRTPETIHIHQLYPPSNISAVFWRWFFLFPPVVGTNKYLYLEPQWPLVFEGQPSFKQGPNSNQNKGPHLGSRSISFPMGLQVCTCRGHWVGR